MSHPPGPPRPPHGAPPPPYGAPPGPPPGPPYGPPPAARRRRPRAAWFALPAVMVLVGIVLAVVGFVTTLGAATDVDGIVPVDGAPHEVTLDGSRDRLLMHPEGSPAPDCTVRDGGGGAELALEQPSGRVTYGDASGSWVGWAVVAPTGASVELTCTGVDGLEVRVSPDPGGAGPIVGGVLSAIGGIGLVLLGLVVLLLVAVLYATGAPRSTTRDGDASTDRSASGSAG